MSNIDKMLETNLAQKKYYEVSDDEELYNKEEYNFLTEKWMNLRNKLVKFRVESGIEPRVNEIQKTWLGDLSQSKVLDFGCFSGNPLSLTLAKESEEYLGIDLSESATKQLQEKIDAKKIQNAKAQAVDFLSEDFQTKYKDYFDVVYAKSVIHHFRYFEDFLISLKNVVKPGGFIITFDPLNTYSIIKIMRSLYRPFQSDSEWEFPLTEESINLIEKHFEITNMHGIIGKSKQAFFTYLFNEEKGIEKAKKYIQFDFDNTHKVNKHFKNCLQVIIKFKKN